MNRPRILIVEDEAIVARDISQQLGSLGYEPAGHTLRAEEGIALADQLRPDLVLMDIQLAGAMDGIEAARAIREQFAIPVIFLTAFVSEQILERAKRSEPFGYIVKPFDERELRTTIEMALYKHQVEARLRQSHAEQAAILRTALDGFWAMDREGRFVEVNDAMCRMTGYAREEMLRMSLADVLVVQHADDIAVTMEKVAQAGSAQFERRQRRKDGTVLDVEVSVRFVPEGGGRYFCFHRDITARKHIEERMQEALNYNRLILEHSPTGIITYTAEGDAVSANMAAARMLGATVEQLEAQNFRRTESWRDSGLLAAAEHALATGREQTLETHFITSFGREVWLACHFVPFTHEGRSHLLLMFTDVTEERRVQDLLRLQSGALDAAANAIIITNRTGVIEWANSAFTSITGYSLAEAVGRNPNLLKSGQHDTAFYRRLWETIRAGGVWHGEMINRRKDGSLYSEDQTITPVRDTRGEITHFISIKQDVTERKRLEEQFLQAQKMEVVGHLASGVAHDFNNILAVILGYAGLMEQELPPGDVTRPMVEEVRAAAERAVGLTKQLLIFSRRQKLQAVVLDPNEALTGMQKMLRRLVDESIELTFALGPAIGRVKADSGYLGQVVLNLVVNARDAMPNGGTLTIATSNCTRNENSTPTHPGGAGGDYVMLSVSDTGCGIPDEVQARMFETFFTTKPAGKGTGLGLATCQTIVQQSGGHIEFESEVGRGTTFRVYLPRADQPLEFTDELTRDGTLPRGTETLLVVEDEPSLRHLAARLLEIQGYAVLRANSGQDGLRVAREHKGPPIRLVVTDVIMPEMSGIMMVEWLAAAYPHLKILYTSGYTDGGIEAKCKLDPNVAFLAKPYTPASLTRKVRAMLDNHADTAYLRKPEPDPQSNPSAP